MLIGGLACLAGLSALAARPGATLSGYERGGGSTAQKAVSAYVPLWATAKPDGGTAAADLGAARPRAPVAARVYLTERDPRGLAAYTAAVSDPGSTLYRHFLTPGQARQRFGPAPGQSAAVASWLRASGLRVTDVTRHSFDAGLPPDSTGPAGQSTPGSPGHPYLITFGQDETLNAGPGYDDTTGVGTPTARYFWSSPKRQRARAAFPRLAPRS